MDQDNFPFWEAKKKADDMVNAGHIIHQKFTCIACGSRQTMEAANSFFLRGTCELCGCITDIEEQGCNYMMIIKGTSYGR